MSKTENPAPQTKVTGEPWGAYTIDYLGCEYVGCDIDQIKKIAEAGSKGPTEVVYLYAGLPPQAHVARFDIDVIRAALRDPDIARYPDFVTEVGKALDELLSYRSAQPPQEQLRGIE